MAASHLLTRNIELSTRVNAIRRNLRGEGKQRNYGRIVLSAIEAPVIGFSYVKSDGRESFFERFYWAIV